MAHYAVSNSRHYGTVETDLIVGRAGVGKVDYTAIGKISGKILPGCRWLETWSPLDHVLLIGLPLHLEQQAAIEKLQQFKMSR